MKKVIAGSVLAAAAVAGLFGAGTAQAAPGVSVNVNGHESGIGDHGTLTGASTTSTKGNVAVAVSVFGPASAGAQGGSNNSALAVGLDGKNTAIASVYGFTDAHTGNSATTVNGLGPTGAAVLGGSNNHSTVLLAGGSVINAGLKGSNNNALSVGSDVEVNPNGVGVDPSDTITASAFTKTRSFGSSNTSISVCGGSVLSAQGRVSTQHLNGAPC